MNEEDKVKVGDKLKVIMSDCYNCGGDGRGSIGTVTKVFGNYYGKNQDKWHIEIMEAHGSNAEYHFVTNKYWSCCYLCAEKYYDDSGLFEGE